MTDLTQFADLIPAQEEGIVVDILHPVTGDPIGMSVQVAGPDSERARKARQAVMNANMRSNAASRPKANELEESQRKVIAKSVISWIGVELDGKELDCTTDNVIKVFADYPFIYEQVSGAAANRAGFIKG